MKFLSIILVLIAVALIVLFTVKDNDFLLVSAIIAVIVGFWYAVFQIPKESDS
jgi:hypothetical protein